MMSRSVNSSLLRDGTIDAGPEGDWAAGRSILAYGVPIGVRTNKPEFLDRILDYAPPLWQPSSNRSVERLFSFRFAGGSRSTHLLLDGLKTAERSRSLKGILEAFEVRVKMYVAEMARRRVFVHAAVVGWQGKAIIVPGRSMSGKTSLAAELVQGGADYYSDEYAVLDGRGRVHPYPKPLASRRDGAGKQKKIGVNEIGGSTGTKPLPVGLVVVSPFKAGAHWQPRQLSAGQAVLELLANTIPARRKPEMVIPTLHRAVSGATTLKGVRGEAARTARLILDWREKDPVCG